MVIDDFLKIGHSHTMCQDYIISGTEPFPYIILSDGCSSAANSDIGARLLCHAALKNIMRNSDRLDEIGWHELGHTTICDAKAALDMYFPTLSIECLDATLIVAYRTETDYKILIYGDGCIYFVQPDGAICYDRTVFEPNAPAYLRYWIKGEDEYLARNVKQYITVKRDFHREGVISMHKAIKINDTAIPISQVKALFVASDGIESFMFKDEALYKSKYLDMLNALRHSRGNISYNDAWPVPKIKELNFLDVFNEISQFKLLKGPFLSRRVKKVLKEYNKTGFVNDDDLSIGCFYED